MKREIIQISLVIICLLFLVNSCASPPNVRKTKPFGPITQKPVQKMEIEEPKEVAKLKKEVQIEPAQKDKSIKKLRVTANRVNIRGGPGTKFKIITTARKGLVLEQLDKSGGWFKIKLPDGKIGWISGKLVK